MCTQFHLRSKQSAWLRKLPAKHFRFNSECMSLICRDRALRPLKGSISDFHMGGSLGDLSALFDAVMHDLKSFELSGCFSKLSVNEVSLVSLCLTQTHLLVNLSLYGCRLGDPELMRTLCLGLNHNKSVKRLSIEYGEITDQGLAVLLEHWNENSTIEELSLAENHLGVEGVAKLMNAIPQHEALKCLDISCNQYVGLPGIEIIAMYLPQIQLQTLDISGCAGITEDSFEVSFLNENYKTGLALATRLAGCEILKGIQQNFTLHSFETQFNGLPESFQKKIKVYLEMNKCGRYLLTQEATTLAGLWSNVLAFCNLRPSVIFFFLRENPSLILLAGQHRPSWVKRKRKSHDGVNNILIPASKR